MNASRTVLQALVDALTGAAAYNRNVEVAPAAILWPDEKREWEPLIPVLRKQLPQLFILGPYHPEERSGPAIWLKCALARTLPGFDWPEEATPIVYLPGYSRAKLRPDDACPDEVKPLVELQYRGTIWSQKSHRDWTVLAFLESKHGGLGLDIAGDTDTHEAMRGALVKLADTKVSELQGKRLEAQDFHGLLNQDPVRTLLRWMNDSSTLQKAMTPPEWMSFQAICRADFQFDPETDGVTTAADALAEKRGKWESVWERFAEAPTAFPKVPELIETASNLGGQGLFPDRSTRPHLNRLAEADLRKGLTGLGTLSEHEAAARVLDLEKEHGPRREWVWARMGQSPLATALAHIAAIAEGGGKAPGGATLVSWAEWYTVEGYRLDEAAWRALAACDGKDDERAVEAALAGVYKPWLARTAERFQRLVQEQGYPGDKLPRVEVADGECILFADGLRLDCGEVVASVALGRFQVKKDWRWVAFPSVTATAKAAVSPVAHLLKGWESGAEAFTPGMIGEDKALTTDRFRKLLGEVGVQFLMPDETGQPSGKAWTEIGDLDKVGHGSQIRMARHIPQVLSDIGRRVTELLDAGWQRVRVVTDHGWLLVPGEMPKADLPGYLAASKWGRCALLKGTTSSTLPRLGWYWEKAIAVAYPPGIHSFFAGNLYSHGGLSLQECVVPVIEVTNSAAGSRPRIDEVSWRGLRCTISVSEPAPGLRVDIRAKATDGGSTKIGGERTLPMDGRLSFLVEDDRLEGTSAALVLLDASGRLLDKRSTTIGGD